MGKSNKGAIWITTYRRPDLVARCVSSMVGKGLPINVVVPDDESSQYRFPTGVNQCILCPEDSHKGPGVARAQVAVWALQQGHDVIVYSDDDVVVKPGSDLSRLVSDFEGRPKLGLLTGVRQGPLEKRLSTGWVIGALFAVSLRAYSEVDGIDPQHFVYEDTDLELRVRIAGYDIAKDHMVLFSHQMELEGGLSVLSPDRTRDRIAHAELVIRKYPEGLVFLKGGDGPDRWHLSRDGRKLAALRKLYARGVIVIDRSGVRVVK